VLLGCKELNFFLPEKGGGETGKRWRGNRKKVEGKPEKGGGETGKRWRFSLVSRAIRFFDKLTYVLRVKKSNYMLNKKAFKAFYF
jgi:hypothetical protein